LANPNFKDKGDLLSTLLKEESIKNNTKDIIDSCLTFFFAGTQTLTFSNSNLIMYAMQNKSLMTKIRSEIDPVFEKHGKLDFEAI
jgi:cytochrome P450